MIRTRRAVQPEPEQPDVEQPSALDSTAGPCVSARRTLGGAAGAAVSGVGSVLSGAAGQAMGALRTAVSPTTIIGTATEAAWLAAHVVTYPSGVLADHGGERSPGYRVEHLSPVRRGLLVSNLEAAGTPILLIHGFFDNRSVFSVLRLGLHRRGFGRVATMNYSPFAEDVRVVAARLAEEVEALVAETGYERIHIVGHSLGGIIARYYVTRLGGDERVHTLVTLGSPHQGTLLSYVWPWPSLIVRQLRPGSGLLQELAKPAPGCRTRFLCYWSDWDEAVLPHRSAALDHPDLNVRNIELHRVGHVSLPIVGSVVQGISDALAQLDADGSMVTPGVSPLTAKDAPKHA